MNAELADEGGVSCVYFVDQLLDKIERQWPDDEGAEICALYPVD